jgi:RNA polymerase sigma factor (sigma-70 family)
MQEQDHGGHGGPRGPKDFFDEKHTHITEEIIRRVVYRRGGLPPGCPLQDFIQDVLLRLLSWTRTGRTVENPVGLLVRLTENLLVDTHRWHRAQRRDYLKEVWIDDPERSEVQHLAGGGGGDVRGRILLDELRATLSGKERDLFERYFIEGSTITEIAVERGVSKQAVSAQLGRLLKKLRPFV